MPHPSAVVLQPDMEFERALCQEAAFDYSMTHRSKKRTGHVCETESYVSKRCLGEAPLELFWKHVREERALGRTMTKDDCDSGLGT